MSSSPPAHSLRAVLEREHEQIEAWLRDLQEAAGVGDTRRLRDTFVSLATRLRRLFSVEERFAFARFEDESGLQEVGPTVDLRREHRAIERRLERIWSTMAAAEPAGLPATLREFDALIADHLRREKTVLWDVCERLLDGSERQETRRVLSGGQEGSE